jgi:hypothetical protein
MHIEFLLEEQSAQAALDLLLPKLLPPAVTWGCYPHRGKTDLLQRLPADCATMPAASQTNQGCGLSC